MTILEFERKPRRKPKKTLKTEAKKTIKALMITLGLMIAILSTVYLVFFVKSSARGYTLEQLKLKNEALETEKNFWNSKVTEAASSLKLQKNEKIKNMGEENKKKYITEEDNLIK